MAVEASISSLRKAMNDRIGQRIARELGVDNLTELLADKLSGSDLHSLLLAVIKRRLGKSELYKLIEGSPVTKACDLDARLINSLEATTYQLAESFQAIELAPVVPLGSVSGLAGLDQGNVLSTIRGYECASDPTIGMALECAGRRKQVTQRKLTTKLCTNQRVLRFPQPENPAFTSHFKLFAMVSAGRDLGSSSFETTALYEHIDFYLRLLAKLGDEQFAFSDIVVELSDTAVISELCSKFEIDRTQIKAMVRARDHGSSAKVLDGYKNIWPRSFANIDSDLEHLALAKQSTERLKKLDEFVCQRLRSQHPIVRFDFNLHRLTGLGYYQGPCFHIKLKNQAGESFMLADGGFVDWTQLLLGDNKERLMTSAIGTELICRLFTRQ